MIEISQIIDFDKNRDFANSRFRKTQDRISKTRRISNLFGKRRFRTNFGEVLGAKFDLGFADFYKALNSPKS